MNSAGLLSGVARLARPARMGDGVLFEGRIATAPELFHTLDRLGDPRSWSDYASVAHGATMPPVPAAVKNGA
jgi:hypothetical protein